MLISRTNIQAMNTSFRQIRSRLGLTQAALAESLGVSQGNIAHYERGQTVPPPVAQKLIDCAAKLGHALTFDDVYAQTQTHSGLIGKQGSQKTNRTNTTPEQVRDTESAGGRSTSNKEAA